MRKVLAGGAQALLLVLIMFVGSLVLWIGTPVGWLWIGSQIQSATESVGAAIMTMLVGVIVTIAVLVWFLLWLSNRHRAVRVAQGHEDSGHFVLESVLVVSAGIALAAFGVWFFFLAGTSPIPLNLSY
jgi:heme/copper-type cytochrome/quinol oxidase subunit 2